LPGFYILFVGLPAALAFVLGIIFHRHPVIAGLIGVGILAALLVAINASHGVVTMLPFTAIVSALALLPAIAAALAGSATRTCLTKEP
jgi:hypothetical protein